MSSAGLSIDDLRELVKKDLEASNELQQRIDRIRNDVAAGQNPDSKELGLMGVEHKSIGKDLVSRIEQIEQQKNLAASDRNMLQALTARLGVHDLQSARIAELGDLRAPKTRSSRNEKSSHGSRTGSYDRDNLASPHAKITESENPTPPTTLMESTLAFSGYSDLATEPEFLESSRATSSSFVEDDDGDEWSDDDEVKKQIELEEADEPNVDKPSWPLLYRIVDIGPNTPDRLFEGQLVA